MEIEKSIPLLISVWWRTRLVTVFSRNGGNCWSIITHRILQSRGERRMLSRIRNTTSMAPTCTLLLAAGTRWSCPRKQLQQLLFAARSSTAYAHIDIACNLEARACVHKALSRYQYAHARVDSAQALRYRLSTADSALVKSHALFVITSLPNYLILNTSLLVILPLSVLSSLLNY